MHYDVKEWRSFEQFLNACHSTVLLSSLFGHVCVIKSFCCHAVLAHWAASFAESLAVVEANDDMVVGHPI